MTARLPTSARPEKLMGHIRKAYADKPALVRVCEEIMAERRSQVLTVVGLLSLAHSRLNQPEYLEANKMSEQCFTSD